MNSGHDLWAVSCLFNPSGNPYRAPNHREFRRRLSVPLVTVELSVDGQFELEEGDADVLIQLSGASLLWQKERLLNLGLRYVPPDVGRVAWLDGDIVFADDSWIAKAHRELDRYPMIQLFRQPVDLPLHATAPGARAIRRNPGFAAAWQLGLSGAESLSFAGRSEAGHMTGLAWAAHRDLLDRHGLYDACIIGGGDRAIACAAVGCFEPAVARLFPSQPAAEHYLHWARPFAAAVDSRIGFVDVEIWHLWHGGYAARRHGARTLGLRPFQFDPTRDIRPADNHCWQWSSAKPELHAYVHNYFWARDPTSV